MDARQLPLQNHLTVFGDPVLLLLSAHQTVGIDGFQADKHAYDTSAFGLLNELRQPVTHGVHLDDELDVEFLIFAQVDQPVEDRFPVHIAGEVIVGDEEPIDALCNVVANNLLDVICSPPPGLAALHIDDGAERAKKRTATPRVETGHHAAGALDLLSGQNRQRGPIQ